jgi:hypothetical protein
MSRYANFSALFINLVFLLAAVDPVLAKSTVLFDQGHGQRLVIDGNRDLDLSSFAELFREAGLKVTATDTPLTANILVDIKALILSGAFKPYTPEEIEVITAFVERGGALCIMLHIAPPLAPLLHRLGVEHSNGVIREQENTIDGNPLNFRVSRLTNHPLFQGLKQFTLYGVWALLENNLGVQAIARTSPASWIDLNGNGQLDPDDAAKQPFAVAVAGQSGSGRFVVFGDDAIFQNKFLTGDNLTLGRNLAAWLSAGTVQPEK